MMEPHSQDYPVDEFEPARPAQGSRIAAILCLLVYALLGWLRFYEGLVYQSYFTQLKIWPGPLYIILSGLSIGLGFSLAILFLIFRSRFAPPYTRILGMLFLGWLWVDHIWLGTRQAFHHQLIVNILISAVTMIIMFIFVRDKDYLKEKHHGQP